MSQIEWIVKPRLIDDDTKRLWFDEYDRKFECHICGKPLCVGMKFACTFSNFGGHHGGNPITGDCCFNIPFEKRLKIYDEQLVVQKEISKIAYDRIMK